MRWENARNWPFRDVRRRLIVRRPGLRGTERDKVSSKGTLSLFRMAACRPGQEISSGGLREKRTAALDSGKDGALIALHHLEMHDRRKQMLQLNFGAFPFHFLFHPLCVFTQIVISILSLFLLNSLYSPTLFH